MSQAGVGVDRYIVLTAKLYEVKGSISRLAIVKLVILAMTNPELDREF